MKRRPFLQAIGSILGALFVPVVAAEQRRLAIFPHPSVAKSIYVPASYISYWSSVIRLGDICMLNDNTGQYMAFTKSRFPTREIIEEIHRQDPSIKMAICCWSNERAEPKLMSWPDLSHEVQFVNYVKGRSPLFRER